MPCAASLLSGWVTWHALLRDSASCAVACACAPRVCGGACAVWSSGAHAYNLYVCFVPYVLAVRCGLRCRQDVECICVSLRLPRWHAKHVSPEMPRMTLLRLYYTARNRKPHAHRGIPAPVRPLHIVSFVIATLLKKDIRSLNLFRNLLTTRTTSCGCALPHVFLSLKRGGRRRSAELAEE